MWKMTVLCNRNNMLQQKSLVLAAAQEKLARTISSYNSC